MRELRRTMLVLRRMVGSARLLCTLTVIESPLLAVKRGPGKPPLTRVALRVNPSGEIGSAASVQSLVTVAACTATAPEIVSRKFLESQCMRQDVGYTGEGVR